MKKTACLAVVAALIGLVALPVLADEQEKEVGIKVTPDVLIPNNQGGHSHGKGPAQAANLVTVHVEYALEAVNVPEGATLTFVKPDLTVATLDAKRVFADDCGDLVAKFDAQEIKKAAEECVKKRFDEIELLFRAVLKPEHAEEGEHTIFGSDEVRVKVK